MLDVSQWLALLVLAALVAQDTTAGPQIRFCEPIVVGPVAGWIAGDAATGTLIGISAQLFWIGTVPAGMSTFVDVGVATVVAAGTGAAVAAGAGGQVGSALAFVLIVPVGLFGSALTTVERRLNGHIAARAEDEATSPARLARMHLSGWLTSGVRGAAVGAAGLLIGLVLVPALAEWAAERVSGGLIWAGMLGGGAGTALGTTIRNGRVRWSALGAVIAIAIAAALIAFGRTGWSLDGLGF